MAARLDHLILPVNDVPASVAFYEGVLGFGCEGERPVSGGDGERPP